MRKYIIIANILLMLSICSCRSHKEIASEKSIQIDSTAYTENHRTIAAIDSVMRSTSFDFDTLEVYVERPSVAAVQPERIRLKAVKGRVVDLQQEQRKQLDVQNQIDSVAYRVAAAEASVEQTASTQIYNPPDVTTLGIIVIVVIGLLLYFRYCKN